ncbi:MAG: TadE/TadG family type IV pilus assembly protein [Stappiaceae bacterium]
MHMLRICRKVSRAKRSFTEDQNGVAAVEFALVVPILIVLFFGSVELSNAVTVDRKVSQVALTMADLVAQSKDRVTPNEMNEYFDLSDTMVAPFSAADMEIVVSSVSADEDGNLEVDWSHANSNGSKWSKGAVPPITIPDEVATPNSSIVVTEVKFEFKPLFGAIFNDITGSSAINLESTYFLQPRQLDTVPCNGC